MNAKEEEIQRFLRNIRQNTPGLYVPISRTLRLEKFGPRLAVLSTYSEFSEAKDSEEKLWKTLNNIPFTERRDVIAPTVRSASPSSKNE